MPRDDDGAEAPFVITVGPAPEASTGGVGEAGDRGCDAAGVQKGRPCRLNPGAHVSLEVAFQQQAKVMGDEGRPGATGAGLR